MEADPAQRGVYYSPMLHLAILGVGWRYMTDERVIRTYYDLDSVPNRGEQFIDAALHLLIRELADPRMSTVIGLVALSEYHTGMLKEYVYLERH